MQQVIMIIPLLLLLLTQASYVCEYAAAALPSCIDQTYLISPETITLDPTVINHTYTFIRCNYPGGVTLTSSSPGVSLTSVRVIFEGVTVANSGITLHADLHVGEGSTVYIHDLLASSSAINIYAKVSEGGSITLDSSTSGNPITLNPVLNSATLAITNTTAPYISWLSTGILMNSTFSFTGGSISTSMSIASQATNVNATFIVQSTYLSYLEVLGVVAGGSRVLVDQTHITRTGTIYQSTVVISATFTDALLEMRRCNISNADERYGLRVEGHVNSGGVHRFLDNIIATLDTALYSAGGTTPRQGALTYSDICTFNLGSRLEMSNNMIMVGTTTSYSLSVTLAGGVMMHDGLNRYNDGYMNVTHTEATSNNCFEVKSSTLKELIYTADFSSTNDTILIDDMIVSGTIEVALKSGESSVVAVINSTSPYLSLYFGGASSPITNSTLRLLDSNFILWRHYIRGAVGAGSVVEVIRCVFNGTSGDPPLTISASFSTGSFLVVHSCQFNTMRGQPSLLINAGSLLGAVSIVGNNMTTPFSYALVFTDAKTEYLEIWGNIVPKIWFITISAEASNVNIVQNQVNSIHLNGANGTVAGRRFSSCNTNITDSQSPVNVTSQGLIEEVPCVSTTTLPRRCGLDTLITAVTEAYINPCPTPETNVSTCSFVPIVKLPTPTMTATMRRSLSPSHTISTPTPYDPASEAWEFKLSEGASWLVSGRAMFRTNSTEEWGYVCSDEFEDNDYGPLAFCHSLGLLGITEARFIPAPRTVLDHPILLDDVTCLENATFIQNCTHNPIGIHNCLDGGNELSGVECTIPIDSWEFRLVGGSFPTNGRVEMRPLPSLPWGSIDNSLFKAEDAETISINNTNSTAALKAVCTTLGFNITRIVPTIAFDVPYYSTGPSYLKLRSCLDFGGMMNDSYLLQNCTTDILASSTWNTSSQLAVDCNPPTITLSQTVDPAVVTPSKTTSSLIPSTTHPTRNRSLITQSSSNFTHQSSPSHTSNTATPMSLNTTQSLTIILPDISPTRTHAILKTPTKEQTIVVQAPPPTQSLLCPKKTCSYSKLVVPGLYNTTSTLTSVNASNTSNTTATGCTGSSLSAVTVPFSKWSEGSTTMVYSVVVIDEMAGRFIPSAAAYTPTTGTKDNILDYTIYLNSTFTNTSSSSQVLWAVVAVRYSGPSSRSQQTATINIPLHQRDFDCVLSGGATQATIPLEVVLSAAPPILEAFGKIGDVAVVAAIGTVVPSALVRAGIVTSLLGMLRCEEFDPEEEVDPINSPFGLSLGRPVLAYYRGSVVTVLILMMMVVVFILVLIVILRGVHGSFGTAINKLRLPSSPLVAVLIVNEMGISTSMPLMLYGGSDVVDIVLALLLVTPLLFYNVVYAVRALSDEYVQVCSSEEVPPPSASLFKKCMHYFLEPTHDVVLRNPPKATTARQNKGDKNIDTDLSSSSSESDNESENDIDSNATSHQIKGANITAVMTPDASKMTPGERWLRHNFYFVAEKRWATFGAIEVICGTLTNMLDGLPITTTSMELCIARPACVLALTLLMLALVVWKVPSAVRVQQWCSVVILGGMSIASALVTWNAIDPSNELELTAGYVASVTMLLSMGLGLMDAVVLLITHIPPVRVFLNLSVRTLDSYVEHSQAIHDANHRKEKETKADDDGDALQLPLLDDDDDARAILDQPPVADLQPVPSQCATICTATATIPPKTNIQDEPNSKVRRSASIASDTSITSAALAYDPFGTPPPSDDDDEMLNSEEMREVRRMTGRVDEYEERSISTLGKRIINNSSSIIHKHDIDDDADGILL